MQSKNIIFKEITENSVFCKDVRKRVKLLVDNIFTILKVNFNKTFIKYFIEGKQNVSITEI